MSVTGKDLGGFGHPMFKSWDEQVKLAGDMTRRSLEVVEAVSHASFEVAKAGQDATEDILGAAQEAAEDFAERATDAAREFEANLAAILTAQGEMFKAFYTNDPEAAKETLEAIAKEMVAVAHIGKKKA